jgi:hypothetical protein
MIALVAGVNIEQRLHVLRVMGGLPHDAAHGR